MQEESCRPDQYTFTAAIQSCELFGDVGHAQNHFQNMQQMGIVPTTVVCNALMAVQASVGDLHGADRTLKEMRLQEVSPDIVSFNSAIATAAKAADREAVARLLSEMKESGLQEDVTTYTSVVKSLVSNGDMLEAEKWIAQATEEKMSNPAPFNCLIDGYAKAGDFGTAEAVLDRMRYASIQPNRNSYNSLISGCAKNGNMKMAVTSMSRMRSQNMQPDVISYTSLISGFAAKGQMRLAEEWLDNMSQASLEPNAVTFATILRSCEKLHDTTEAERFQRKMKEMQIEPNLVIFNTLLSIAASARDISQAETLFQGLVPVDMPDIMTFGSLVKAASRVPDFARSRCWLDRAKLDELGLTLDARIFYSLLAAAASVGDIDLAHKVIREMNDDWGLPEDVVSCTALIRACVRTTDFEEAEKTLERMESKGICPNEYTLNAILTVCLEAAFPKRAEHWFSQLTKRGAPMKIVVFNSLIANWIEDPARIQQWIGRMKVVGVDPDVITLNGLLNSFAIVCDVELARQAWSSLEEAGLRPTLASYRIFSKALARQGCYEEVSALLSRMAREGRSKDAFCYRALITACAKVKTEDAVQVAKEAFNDAQAMLANDLYAQKAFELLFGRYRHAKLVRSLNKKEGISAQEAFEEKEEKVADKATAANNADQEREKTRNATSKFVLQSRQSLPYAQVTDAKDASAPEIQEGDEGDPMGTHSKHSFVLSAAAEPLIRTFRRNVRGERQTAKLRLKPRA
eukprot:Skav226286  [mRNA]  locus=scaffold3301:171050:173284:+ [translate_table: standard]